MPNGEKSLDVEILRSQLGRVRGLGAARAGSGTWWVERLTGIALIPLSLWFIASAIRLEGATRADVIAWLHAPVPLVLMLCLIIATFWHMEMGLRASIEDYVHNEVARVASLLFIRGLSIVTALFCFIAALRLGL
jgi:succinate dehydrogenase / fumarate reductase, membrane anchor subunit